MMRAVIVVAVKLEWIEGRVEAEGSRVADHALGPGREPPVLLATAARLGRVGHLEHLGVARAADQLAVGLLGVPSVGITGPFSLLANQQTRLDSPAGGLAGGFDHVEAERLHQDRAVGQTPGTARVELGLLHDLLQARQHDEPLHRRPVSPLRRIDVERDRGRVWLVAGDRFEQARLAQLGRERLLGLVGLGRRLEAIESGHLVDDVQLTRVIGAEAGDVERVYRPARGARWPWCRRA